MQVDLINMIALKDDEGRIISVVLFDGTKGALKQLTEDYMEKHEEFDTYKFRRFVIEQGNDLEYINIQKIRAG